MLSQRLHYIDHTHVLHLEDYPIKRHKLQYSPSGLVDLRRALHRYLYQLPSSHPKILPKYRPQII